MPIPIGAEYGCGVHCPPPRFAGKRCQKEYVGRPISFASLPHHGLVQSYQREELGKELTYFRNQRWRMRYAQYRHANVPIGNGVVEVACKTLVIQRLKRSGMRWRMAGGQAILTFRSVIPGGRWERAWALVGNDFRKSVQVVTANDPEVLDPAA